jgi:hypothetical protein
VATIIEKAHANGGVVVKKVKLASKKGFAIPKDVPEDSKGDPMEWVAARALWVSKNNPNETAAGPSACCVVS